MPSRLAAPKLAAWKPPRDAKRDLIPFVRSELVRRSRYIHKNSGFSRELWRTCTSTRQVPASKFMPALPMKLE